MEGHPPHPPTFCAGPKWSSRKGALAKAYDVALAKKYLLASTMLDNCSVDVWLELADMSDNEEEKAWFRKEAQRLLGRSPGSSGT
ncbi:MAG: hypothetical protein ACETWR_00135 [Anaerolineae bacterium]